MATRDSSAVVTRTARCACGRLSVGCAGEPVSVSLCHCRDCQRRTGSTYGIAAFFLRGMVEFFGKTSAYSRDSDGGHAVVHRFCPTCGSTVWWEPARKPELVAVAVGAFADPWFPAPTKSVYEEHRYAWVRVPSQ